MTGLAASAAPARLGLERRGWAEARYRVEGPARVLLQTCAVRPGAAGAAVLIAYYLWCYLGDRFLPGNNLQHPLGWWDWWDQGRYLDSAHALAAGVMDPLRHWYPLGYPVLAAPFTRWSHGHPFLPVNLASLVLSYAGFLAFARRAGVGRGWAVLLFLVGAAGSRTLFEGWIIPWNTTPVSALIWLLLATTAAHMDGKRRPLLIGLMAAAIPLIRPTELLLAAPCVLAAAVAGRRRPKPGRRTWLREPALMAAGGLLVAVPYGLLHWHIYGLEPSPYMALSTSLGFTLHDFGWKAYVVLADPRAWFGDGRGLLWRAPWAALALPGLAVAWAHGRAAALLAVLIVVHTVLYLSYVDMLPTGLWRFFNAHYWQWAMPGLALLAFLLVRDLLCWRRAPMFPLAPVALLASVPVMLMQAEPLEVPAGVPAKMLAYVGPPLGFDDSYPAKLALQDSMGEVRGLGELRAVPMVGGMRVYALRRPFGDGPAWLEPPANWRDGLAPTRYAIRWSAGLPCWMRLAACERTAQSLMPREPDF